MIYLGIDCGTQSTKTVALDGESGEILAHASQSYGMVEGLPAGHMEQEPRVWIEALENTIGGVAAALGDRSREVRGIGVSGQQHGLVPLGGANEVIRPAKLWCDTSTEAQCDLFRQAFGGKSGLIQLMGNDMLAGFTAPKILWLKQHEPNHFSRLARVFLPHDYLNWWLTGEATMEYGDASGSALLDVRSRTWCRPLADFIDPDLIKALPPVRRPTVPAGMLKPDLARRWGFASEVVVSAGGGDNMMGAIGTSNCAPGRVTASLGTSGTIYAYASAPMVDPEGEIAAFCDSTGGWLPLLCTMNVTVATEAVRGLFGWPIEDLDRQVNQVPPGAEGLIFLPYLQGERTPNLPRATGVFHGLTTRNMSPAHLARAAMEGATLGLAYGLRRLRGLGVVPTEIRLTGGGSKSRLWRQLCADIFGVPIVTLRHAEGAALGAAIQALAAVETRKSIADWADEFARANTSEAAAPDRSFDYPALLDRHTALTAAIFKTSAG
jgi:xylulokinase